MLWPGHRPCCVLTAAALKCPLATASLARMEKDDLKLVEKL